MRILYTIDNLVELFRVDKKMIRMWTRLGILPVIEGQTPVRYLKKDIDSWVQEGDLDKHRPVEYTHKKGVWL